AQISAPRSEPQPRACSSPPDGQPHPANASASKQADRTAPDTIVVVRMLHLHRRRPATAMPPAGPGAPPPRRAPGGRRPALAAADPLHRPQRERSAFSAPAPALAPAGARRYRTRHVDERGREPRMSENQIDAGGSAFAGQAQPAGDAAAPGPLVGVR